MIRRFQEQFQLVENIQGVSDGMGGNVSSEFKLIQEFRGLSLASDEEVDTNNLGVMSTYKFDIITPINLPDNWLQSRLEIHFNGQRLRIIRYRDLKRLRQITVEVIGG